MEPTWVIAVASIFCSCLALRLPRVLSRVRAVLSIFAKVSVRDVWRASTSLRLATTKRLVASASAERPREVSSEVALRTAVPSFAWPKMSACWLDSEAYFALSSVSRAATAAV